MRRAATSIAELPKAAQTLPRVALQVRLVAVVLVAAIPIFALILIAGVQTRTSVVGEAHAEAVQLAGADVAIENVLINSTRTVLQTAAGRLAAGGTGGIGGSAGTGGTGGTGGSGCAGVMRGLTASAPYYADFGVIGADGVLECSAVNPGGIADLADQPFFKEASTGAAFAVGSLGTDQVGGQPVLIAGVPLAVPERPGGRVAVLFAAIRATALFESGPHGSPGAIALPKGAAVTIVDSSGVVLARGPVSNPYTGRRLLHAPLVEAVLSGRLGKETSVVDLDGVTRLAAAAPLGGGVGKSAWVVVTIPAQPDVSGIDAIFARDLVGLVLVTVAALILAILFGERLFGRLQRQALLDSLTGTFNRYYFSILGEREMRRAVREGTGVGMLSIDLDNFKQVNDSHGHDAGDRVLRGVAEVFRSEARDTDLVVRLGGEEFGVLMTGVTPEEAILAAERIRARVSGMSVPVRDGSEISVTISVGVACGGGEALLDDLLSEADAKLYEAKAAGRDCVRA